MKKLLSILLLIISLYCVAQKQGDKWYFGIQSGLDFSSGTPIILSNGQTGTDLTGEQEGTSCISDSAGNILFYSGGKTLWNHNHIPMPNGAGLSGETSSTQSCIIIPLPGSDSIFYVFTSDKYQSYSNPPEKGYRYSIVNMCLDNGNGDVIAGQKNILLSDSSTEKLAACEDSNKTGYWILGHKMFSDEFHAWHLTSSGIINTVISKTGTIHGWNNSTSSWVNGAAQGQMKFNPTGTKLAVAIGNFDPAYLDLFDFNSGTGIVSNPCHIVIDSALSKRIYGTEFSADGTKLYTTVAGGIGGKRLYQFDLTAGGGNCSSIISSRQTIFQSNFNSVMLGMQLAPNGKIYLIGNSFSDLSSINYPNLLGLAAGFDSSTIQILGTNNYTLPSFIAGYIYSNTIVNCSGEGVNEVVKNETIFNAYPNPSTGIFQVQVGNGQSAAGNEYKIEIYNVLGEKVTRSVIPSGARNLTIDLSAQPEGIYFLRIGTSEGIISKKIILSK